MTSSAQKNNKRIIFCLFLSDHLNWTYGQAATEILSHETMRMVSAHPIEQKLILPALEPPEKNHIFEYDNPPSKVDLSWTLRPL